MVAEGNLRVLPPSLMITSFSGYHFSSVVSSCGKSKKQVLRRQLLHCISGIVSSPIQSIDMVTVAQSDD